MRSSRLPARILALACAALIPACHTPVKHGAAASAAVPRDPAQLLSGSWTSRKAGDAAKLFVPVGSYQQGQVRGFWPEAGHYEVSRANPAARTAHVSVISSVNDPAAVYRAFEADAQFSRDGRKMTLVLHKPNGIVQSETFQRIR
jgi:hypothetical protein